MKVRTYSHLSAIVPKITLEIALTPDPMARMRAPCSAVKPILTAYTTIGYRKMSNDFLFHVFLYKYLLGIM